MNLKDWRDAGDFFRHGHNPIFFRSGKPAQEVTLLLHGFPTASFDFHKIWDGLSNSFPLLAVDMIGYGFSAKPRDLDYTTFLQTDVIESLVRHAGASRVHILAHDYGNTITQELLARRAEGGLGFGIASICFLNGAFRERAHR